MCCNIKTQKCAVFWDQKYFLVSKNCTLLCFYFLWTKLCFPLGEMHVSNTILFKTAIFCCKLHKNACFKHNFVQNSNILLQIAQKCMFQTQFCSNSNILLLIARKCMFQTQFCSNSNILQRVWFSCTKIFHGEQKWWKYSIATRMKIFSRRACYYTKMFHGEQKCVFLCRWHTKYVLHKSRWGSGIFYAGCIQMCVLHKSRWGSASTTLFNIVTRQVHNCNLHENIQLRPHENIFTSGALFY